MDALFFLIWKCSTYLQNVQQMLLQTDLHWKTSQVFKSMTWLGMCDKVEAVELSDVGAVRQSHVYNLNVMGYIMHLNPPPYKRTVLRAVYIFSTPLPPPNSRSSLICFSPLIPSFLRSSSSLQLQTLLSFFSSVNNSLHQRKRDVETLLVSNC